MHNRDLFSIKRGNIIVLDTSRGRLTNKRCNSNNDLYGGMLVLRVVLRKLLFTNGVNFRYDLCYVNLTLNKLCSNGDMTTRRRTKGTNNGNNMLIILRVRRQRRSVPSLFIRLINLMLKTMAIGNNGLTILTLNGSRVMLIILITTNVISSLKMIFKNKTINLTTTKTTRRNGRNRPYRRNNSRSFRDVGIPFVILYIRNTTKTRALRMIYTNFKLLF